MVGAGGNNTKDNIKGNMNPYIQGYMSKEGAESPSGPENTPGKAGVLEGISRPRDIVFPIGSSPSAVGTYAGMRNNPGRFIRTPGTQFVPESFIDTNPARESWDLYGGKERYKSQQAEAREYQERLRAGGDRTMPDTGMANNTPMKIQIGPNLQPSYDSLSDTVTLGPVPIPANRSNDLGAMGLNHIAGNPEGVDMNSIVLHEGAHRGTAKGMEQLKPANFVDRWLGNQGNEARPIRLALEQARFNNTVGSGFKAPYKQGPVVDGTGKHDSYVRQTPMELHPAARAVTRQHFKDRGVRAQSYDANHNPIPLSREQFTSYMDGFQAPEGNEREFTDWLGGQKGMDPEFKRFFEYYRNHQTDPSGQDNFNHLIDKTREAAPAFTNTGAAAREGRSWV